MTQKEKLILNVHIIQLFLKQLNHLLIQRMHELFHAHLNLLIQQMKQIFRLTWMFYRTRTFALRYNIYQEHGEHVYFTGLVTVCMVR